MKTILKLIAGVIVACAMVCYPRAQNQLIANLTVTNNATFSARTATRVPYFSTGGLLADSATLTYNSGNGTLSATNFSGLFNGNAFTTGTGTLTIAATKTFTDSDNITIASDGIGTRALNVGSGGTLGSAAFTPSSAYEVPLTFSTGLTRTINTITIDSTVMTLTGSQVVTNKSISGATNTLTAIPNSALTNSSITIGSTAIALGGNSATLAGLTSVSSTSFTGALTGNATTATALAAGRTISMTGDVTYTSAVFDGSGNVTGTATLANIPTAVPMAGTLLATAIAAPSTPAAGKGSIYVDSTSKNLAVKDDAGVVKHGVQTNSGAASNFLTAISDAGVVSRAQPAFSDLSGSATGAQMPAFTGDITTSAGSTATTLATVATAGTTGSSTAIPVVTIDAKGRTTGITTAAVVAPAGTLTGTTLAGNVVSSSLTSLGTIGNLVATTATFAGGSVTGTGTANWDVISGGTSQQAYIRLIGRTSVPADYIWYLVSAGGVASNKFQIKNNVATEVFGLSTSGDLTLSGSDLKLQGTNPFITADTGSTTLGFRIWNGASYTTFMAGTTAGLAVTGVSSSTGASTASSYSKSTSGNFIVGGVLGDATFLDSGTGSSISIRPGGSNAGVFSSTGLVVTGGLSSTTGSSFATSSGAVRVGTASQVYGSTETFAVLSGGVAVACKTTDVAGTPALGVWHAATSGDNTFISFATDAGGTTRGGITYNRVGGLINYGTTSDARKKTNFRPWSLGDRFDQIEIGEFDWKSGGTGRGVLAQSLYRVFPDAVTAGDDGATITKQWSVDYGKLTIPIIAEVKALRARVLTLEHQPRSASDPLARAMAAGALIIAITALVRRRAGK